MASNAHPGAGTRRGDDRVESERARHRDHRWPPPVVLVSDPSMSGESERRNAASSLIPQLVAAGRRVVGIAVANGGGYEDVVAMKKAGALAVYAVPDTRHGSPGNTTPPLADALTIVLAMISSDDPDVIVGLVDEASQDRVMAALADRGPPMRGRP